MAWLSQLIGLIQLSVPKPADRVFGRPLRRLAFGSGTLPAIIAIAAGALAVGTPRFASAGPLNDECTSAESVPCNGSVTVDNTSATTNPTDPVFSCHFGAAAQGVGTVWYTFTAAADTAFLETNNSGVSDTLLAVYDGSCGSLTEIACSEDEGAGLLSEVCAYGLTPGATYYVQVASYSASSQGSITLDITCPCPGAIDECAGAMNVPCNGSVTVDNTFATTNTSDPAFSCHFGGTAQGVGTIWYTFTAAASSAFLETNNSGVSDTLLAVYDGTCGSLTEIACSEDEGVGLLSEVCALGLTPGTTYYVQVASYSASSQGPITLDITCPCPGAPLNDECATAESIPCNGSVTADNTLATTSTSDPVFSCHFGAAAQGVGTIWYEFTAAADTAFLETNNSGVSDTLLAVYDGSCGSLTEIACSEDEGAGLLSEVCALGLTPGATYYVQVASYSAGSQGPITLDITCPCPGLIDECAGAADIPCNGSVTVDNTFATTNPSDPLFSCHFGSPAQGVGTIWYTFTAAATSALLETNNSAVSDTLLAIYDGSCGSLTEIACSEDEGVGLLSEICANGLTPGVTYYVQVASYSASSLGSITLDITCPCTGVEFVRGDCNGDGAMDIGDPILALDHLFGSGAMVPCEDACEANDDGAFDIADAVYMLNYLFTMGAAPPAPFPSCGADPTPDGVSCVMGCP